MISVSKKALEQTAKTRKSGYMDMILKSKLSETETHVVLSESDYFKLQKEYGIPTGVVGPVSVKQAATAVVAIATAKRVSLEVFQERTEICKNCDFVRVNGSKLFCGQCGCSVLQDNKQILNIAKVEENLPAWGCKHPQRPQKGWKR